MARRPRHPFEEEAEMLEEMLRSQRLHDRRNDGVVIFASEHAESAAWERARHLRHLAQLDLDEGTYPDAD